MTYPRERAAFPRERITYSCERTACARESTAYARESAAFPRAGTPFPRERLTFPRQRTPLPHERTAFPCVVTAIPRERTKCAGGAYLPPSFALRRATSEVSVARESALRHAARASSVCPRFCCRSPKCSWMATERVLRRAASLR